MADKKCVMLQSEHPHAMFNQASPWPGSVADDDGPQEHQACNAPSRQIAWHGQYGVVDMAHEAG